jgi:hypothetical protein
VKHSNPHNRCKCPIDVLMMSFVFTAAIFTAHSNRSKSPPRSILGLDAYERLEMEGQA